MHCAILAAMFFTQVPAATEPVKARYERWDAAYLGGVRAGYVHTIVTDEAGDSTKALIEWRLRIVRFNDTVTLGMDSGTFEDADGHVTGIFMKQFLGKEQKLAIDGTVNGNKLFLTLNKTKKLDPAPWTDRVIGVARQQSLFRDKKVGPGDEFTYLSFEPTINLVVTMRVNVKDYEMVATLPGAPALKLLRVDVQADRVKDSQLKEIQLPTAKFWLNEDRDVIRYESQIGGLGEVTLLKTSKAIAESAPTAAAKAVESQRVVPLNVRLPRAHDLKSIVYRITVKGDKNAASGFSTDNRQRPGAANGETFDLTVQKAIVALAEKVGPEYLESSHFINSADANVRTHAKSAVGNEKDPWKKALRIEAYVNKNVRADAQELFATADHVAKTMKGDCTEFAMLSAAMCRAEGVPARTAIGLVYGEVRDRPSFIFHMWTEVWINGQWLALDATLGRGGIGPAHIKVSDQSWHDEASMAPLLPTLNLLGKLSIDVLRTE